MHSKRAASLRSALLCVAAVPLRVLAEFCPRLLPGWTVGPVALYLLQILIDKESMTSGTSSNASQPLVLPSAVLDSLEEVSGHLLPSRGGAHRYRAERSQAACLQPCSPDCSGRRAGSGAGLGQGLCSP